MRCIGRNKKFKRCKNRTRYRYYPFCTHHKWQVLILLFISVPAIITSYAGIYQDLIKPLSESPEVQIDFYNPDNPIFKISNNTNNIVENVLITFGIKDIGKPKNELLPLKSFELSFINPQTQKGPWNVLGNYGKANHRYFGIMYLNCKGCEKLKTYWIYVDRKTGASFYSPRDSTDTWTVYPDSLRLFPEYLERLVPSEERVRIQARNY